LNISSFLNRAETIWHQREAIVDGQKRFTYSELALRVRRLATQLAKVGLKKGDVVSIVAPNCSEFVEIYFACAMLGAILNPINHRLSPKEIAFILRDAGAKTLIIHVDKCEHLQEIIARAGVLEEIVFIGGIPNSRPSVLVFDYDTLMRLGDQFTTEETETSAVDTAHLYYTSGTSGSPKGVILTHTNVFTHSLAAISELGLTEQDTWLHAAPMFHLADAWAIFAITAAGGRHVVLPSFDPPEVLRLIEEERITITNLIPTMLTALLNDPTCAARHYPNLRRIMSGGAAIAPALVRRIMDVFRCDYVQTYGMTESSPYLTLSLPIGDQSRLSPEQIFAIKCRTGRPFMGVDLRVVRPDGSDVEPNDEEVGEIIVRGATITPGYLNLPEVTAATIKNGWLHTGDLAIINKDHSVNIVDRKKDIIITGGETIYSIEIETALLEHPSVLEAAVIGVPDDFWGETVSAVVVLKEDQFAEEQELIDFVKSNIAHFKAPKTVTFVAELPKLGSGKVWKKGVKDWYLAEMRKLTPEEVTVSTPLHDVNDTEDANGSTGEVVEQIELAEQEEEPPAVTVHESSGAENDLTAVSRFNEKNKDRQEE
jgi:acyl-CoA synthetase (AMP-forming)/AMP-acid ligase II